VDLSDTRWPWDPGPWATSSTAADELVAFLDGWLAKFRLSKEYVFIDALPRMSYGKVVNSELVEHSFNVRTT